MGRHPEPREVYIALGSNQGDSPALLENALLTMPAWSDAPLEVSSFWQTSPVDCPPGSPCFLNAVVRLWVRSNETPDTLLAKLQALEKMAGRQPKQVLNEPRPLDLDLLVFGSQTQSTPSLVLPHPRAHQRRFVLQPLAEIAPTLILPGQNQPVHALLAALPPGPEVVSLWDISRSGHSQCG